MPSISFSKYQGLGNDFILVDNRGSAEPLVTPEIAQKMCHRNFGIGGDGVIFAMKGTESSGCEYKMRIYNSDGSEPEMCGNGIRCMARFLQKLEGSEGTAKTYTIETLAGKIVPHVDAAGLVKVDMGPPTLEAAKVPTTLPATKDGASVNAPLSVDGTTFEATSVSMGNPHCIIFVEDLSEFEFTRFGPQIERMVEAYPAKVNVEFVQVLTPTHVRMKVWERGAGPTLACGTGACALAVACELAGKIPAARDVRVTLPGGDLIIDWAKDQNTIFMTGPAELSFTGVIEV
mmetsp:Transcript_39447/g.103259  ORF Transcript_39447/g.103259 Transcript_39447/m.103259 type:complete len:289 (+) Transcript_39447:23-889(+)